MSRWIKYQDDFDSRKPFSIIKDTPGVYVIYVNGIPVYVGQTAKLKKRILTHCHIAQHSTATDTPWGQFDDLFVKISYSTKYGDWAMRELRLIKKLKPIYNCVGSIKKRASK